MAKKLILFSDQSTPSVTEAIMSSATIAEEAYPTGIFTKKMPSTEGGRVSYVAETEPRTVLKFQTATGASARGKGSFTVPLEDCETAMTALQAVDIDDLHTESEESWLSVEEAISQTIRRFADDDDNEFVGFRTRLGKGSKEIKIPVGDWPEFTQEVLPALVKAANAKMSKLASMKQAKKKKADSAT